MVEHACSASTGEAEASLSLTSRPAWSTERIPGYTEKLCLVGGKAIMQTPLHTFTAKTKTPKQQQQSPWPLPLLAAAILSYENLIPLKVLSSSGSRTPS